VNGDVHFVSDFNARELHQSGIEDDPLRVSDFSDGLGHRVILCFTEGELSIETKQLNAERPLDFPTADRPGSLVLTFTLRWK
jgi:hypothetical protein